MLKKNMLVDVVVNKLCNPLLSTCPGNSDTAHKQADVHDRGAVLAETERKMDEVFADADHDRTTWQERKW